jgi:hypothetical protein
MTVPFGRRRGGRPLGEVAAGVARAPYYERVFETITGDDLGKTGGGLPQDGGVNDAELQAVRRLVIGAFRWVEGHADLSRVFGSAEVLRVAGAALAAPFCGAGVTAVASPEARGFVLGALVARELGTGLVLVRKQGSHHPGASLQVRTAPD